MKKQIIVVIIITTLAIAGVIGKVVYDKVYTARALEETNKMLASMGIAPGEVDLSNIDFVGHSPEEIYDIVSAEIARQKSGQQATLDTQPMTTENTQAQASSSDYACTTDPTVSKRGYIVIHGAGGPDAGQSSIKSAVSRDPKYGGFLYFTYDSNKENLATIASRFVGEYNTFLAQGYDGIVIYGQSAGGVIASYAASKLGTSPHVEIHTLASPLNGYKFGSAAEQMSQQLTGINKEIGLGIDPYAKPSVNVSVYHHKTVEDQTLRSYCGSYASLCSPIVIQKNNVPGSSEFSYPSETHDSITNTVVTKTLSCRK